MDTSESLLMGGTAVIVPGQMAYVKLPADVIRNYVDSKFPALAHCPDADFIKGYGHRWMGGHDLLIDVPRTMVTEGPLSAIKQAGHILFTDLPTKDGIPIPLLSKSGFGQWLHDIGIDKGYMKIHLADGGCGILTMTEGTTDLLQAISGTLAMNTGTFFDTFAEGSLEIALAVAAENTWGLAAFNPLVAGYLGGIENVLAGIISGYQTLSVYVDPLDLFGSAGTSALIGFGLSYNLAGGSLSDASMDGIRSGAVGAFYSLSSAFGYGALAGFVSFKLGRTLAKTHNSSMRIRLKIDENAYHQLLDEMCKGNIHLADFLERAETSITLVDNAPTLSTRSKIFNDNVQILPGKFHVLDSQVKVLPEKNEQLRANMRTLPDDSPILANWYRSVQSHH